MNRRREQLQADDIASLSTHELLAFVLSSSPTRRDMNPIASKLLEKYEPRDFYNITESELIQEGLTPAKAQLLKAVCELALRSSIVNTKNRPQILTTEGALLILRPLLAHLNHEEFRVLVLSSKNRLIANIQLYKGTATDSLIRTAEVFREAIVRNCPNVIVAHNHPSLDPTPSVEDYEATRQLIDAGKLLEIHVLDHIIIGGADYISMKSRMNW